MRVLILGVGAALVVVGIVLTMRGNLAQIDHGRRDHVYERAEQTMVGGYLLVLVGLALLFGFR